MNFKTAFPMRRACLVGCSVTYFECLELTAFEVHFEMFRGRIMCWSAIQDVDICSSFNLWTDDFELVKHILYVPITHPALS